jgi:mannose-6-phosphate isomerase-like protein (cupin superfamily)
MDDMADSEAQVQNVYDFSRLDRLPEGTTSLEVTAGAVLTGRSIVCTLVRQPARTGAEAESHAHEQFNYIVQGTMVSDIEGGRVFASRDSILHMPVGAVHTAFAGADVDLVYFAIRDRRQGEASTAPSTAPGKRYVYDMREVRDTGGTPASAEITPDSAMRLPPGVRGKLLTGERLHVCVLRLDPGARISNYRKDNEQIVFAAEGELEVTLAHEPLAVPLAQYCVLHIPPATPHELMAPEGAVIVIAQDKDVTA